MNSFTLKISPDSSSILLPLVKLSPADFYASDQGGEEFFYRLLAHFDITTAGDVIHIKHGIDAMERFSHQPRFTKILHIVTNEPSGKYRKWAAEGPPSYVDDETLLRLIFTMTVMNGMTAAKEKTARELVRRAAMPGGMAETPVTDSTANAG